jgi:hypothetical protein
MASPLSFHIRHEVTPDRCRAVFESILEGQPYQYVLQSDRQETRLRQLGLVATNKLSEEGLALWHLCQQKPMLWSDILHYLHYTLWNANTAVVHGFSWLYREFTNLLWYAKQTYINDALLRPTVGTLIGKVEATQAFESMIAKGTRSGTISLSTHSLAGALNWLEALHPPVIVEQRFERRFFCSPELMLLGLGWVARTSGGEIGIDMLLTPERREAVCMLCLLDSSALDRIIDWILPLYPALMRTGTRAGTYGRFIRFIQWPRLASLGAP